MTQSKHTNALSNEKSPYLLQHAHNPVNWLPWGGEAWKKAKTENKPVFLSVGYSACHWCHVMERESFENEPTAALLNKHFVCVKVDREERPDVDEIYMTAVQMLTGHGGWPMSVFLTPNGLPFYGGTYFPPENRGGRIGFPSLIEQLGEAWQTRNAEVLKVAQNIAGDVQKSVKQRPLAAQSAEAMNSAALLENAVADMRERFDAASGGFGDAPKFPPHHALRLLVYAARQGISDALPLLTLTLDKMALGGIYDHLGGGFHRYSTDAIWLLPHFEKMLYDNALLARVYADAFDLTGKAAYARIARETCDFILRDMVEAANGGFHAALDADSEGEEGKFYVWTPEQIKAVVKNAEAADTFCAAYHIAESGNFRDEATGHTSGANIAYLSVGSDSGATLPDTLNEKMQSARAALLAARNTRIWPGKDDKVITAWNGLMIGALAFCGKTLDNPAYGEAACRAADFCLTTLRKPDGRLMRRWARGEAGLPAFLDDYAFLADGLLDLADATGETKWAQSAQELAEVMTADFWDETEKGFFYTAQTAESETLIAQTKDLFDSATPSPNGVFVRVLVRLGKRSGGERYAGYANQTLDAFGGFLERAPQGTPTLILAASELAANAKQRTSQSAAPLVTLGATLNALRVAPGETAHAIFELVIAPGFHISGRGETESAPTKATLSSDLPASVGPVGFPPAQNWDDGVGNTLAVYANKNALTVPISVSPDAQAGRYALAVSLSCQPCNDVECRPPISVSASVLVEVADTDA